MLEPLHCVMVTDAVADSFLCPVVEILFIHESVERKMSFVSHTQNMNFIFFHTIQQFMSKICVADETVFCNSCATQV